MSTRWHHWSRDWPTTTAWNITRYVNTAGKKCEISLEYGQTSHQKCDIFFTNFQTFLEEKYQNIHLNDKFALKIANISLQKQIETPKFHILSMHVCEH